MKALVVYDSNFGNTERIAQAIAEALDIGKTVEAVPVIAVNVNAIFRLDLLVVGGPTQAHGLSGPLRRFLSGLPDDRVRDTPIAAFDTRLTWPRIVSGSAAGLIAKQLTKKGAHLLMPPESFRVEAREGPLVEGELEHARVWAKELGTRVREYEWQVAKTAAW